MVKYQIRLGWGVKQELTHSIEFIKFATSRDNSLYIVPLPPLFKGTGFHLSFHPSGISHFRTINPKISVDFCVEDFAKALTQDAYKVSFERFLRPPSSGTPALIAIISRRHIQKCLYQIGLNKFIIDLEKIFDYVTLAAVRDTSDLPYALPKLKGLGYIQDDDNIIIAPVETNEFSIFFDYSVYGIRDLEYSLPRQKEPLRKLKGCFLTIEKPMEGGLEELFHLPVFKPLFDPM